MKTIICFSLFLLATSDDRSFERELFPPTISEIGSYMKHTIESIPIFSNNIEILFKQISHMFKTTITVKFQIAQILSLQSSMSEIFMGTVFNYIKDYLNIYCEIAEELIKRRINEPFDNDFVKNIKLEKDLDDFCVVSVLYNKKIYDVKPMFRSILYLQTFTNGPNSMEPETIASDMQKLRSDFNFYYDFDENMRKEDEPVTDEYRDRFRETSHKELFDQLKLKREAFKSMAKMFCSSTSAVPFIKRSLLFEDRVNNDHKDEYFDFVMLKEQCVIDNHIESLNIYNSSKKVIGQWYCNNILTNPSFEFEDYFRDLKLKNDELLEHGNYLANKKDSNVKNNEEITIDIPETKHSLWSLKKQLKKWYNYLDFFQYSQIEAHVLMFSAMKEGNKYFKAINNFFDARCKVGNFNISDDELLFMTYRVFLFQLYYDKLHDEIFEKLHVNFDHDAQTHFKEKIKDVLRYLDFPKNLDENERKELIKNTCTVMKRTFGFNNMDIYAGHELVNLKFVDYYYNDPIVNTHKLISFIEP